MRQCTRECVEVFLLQLLGGEQRLRGYTFHSDVDGGSNEHLLKRIAPEFDRLSVSTNILEV